MRVDAEVVIRKFDAPHEAELAACYLREHGIRARVDNDVLAGMNPLLSVALGGIRLHVPTEKARRAEALLNELANAPVEYDDEDADIMPEPGLVASPRSMAGPYRSPLQHRRSSREADATARRSLAAAVLGIFLLPVLAQAYSLWIALRVPSADLSARGKRDRVAALVIDIAFFSMLLILLL